MSDLNDGPLAVPEVLCRWCNDRGCISCADKRKKRQEQMDAAYKAQFPNGPQPIFTARRDKPEEMEQLKEILHADKIAAAFGPGGGGIDEIEKKCQEAMAKRASE
jgi:hypothetical protein